MKQFFLMAMAWTLLGTTSRAEEESWIYPVQSPGNSGFTSESGVKVASYWSRHLQPELASFEEVVKWYSEKLGSDAVPKALTKYEARPADAADFLHGSATIRHEDAEQSTSIIYMFAPSQRHVTILRPEPDGDTIVISIVGTETLTSIQFLRRQGEPGSAVQR